MFLALQVLQTSKTQIYLRRLWKQKVFNQYQCLSPLTPTITATLHCQMPLGVSVQLQDVTSGVRDGLTEQKHASLPSTGVGHPCANGMVCKPGQLRPEASQEGELQHPRAAAYNFFWISFSHVG
ncbi:hypothetical protein PISMIDRAFT_385262 [Pisolithus microcarpus 441]|uniref:Uncharacterized protein n=1 Tax=Pisolithus microcarpus 441 TaxID=765257 RepID=A0A0C9ZL63_9AGAM|nr:hypothetical protein PISMIDRAFT_385262 [Pisolithus microcarpus 441]